MAVRIESQAEPIPGYKLVERLGGGGFGEVWKAIAPGGLQKAIKFVYGDLRTDSENGDRAIQELKALSRVTTVRHPYVLSLERFDIIDGQLMIVMELADRNLWDRLRECRGQGLPGIPRDELLGYLVEAAEALDMMNTLHQLQHLDIKPQNLFLVHNHIKVADFGLVKDLEGMMASVTGGVTPVYASPETFDGWISRFCDQYSLAIVYQEMLTTQRPFNGNNVRQLILQHLQAAPNLDPLPEADRPTVARALAKNPEDRFPSCQAFVSALLGRNSAVPAPVTVNEQGARPEVSAPRVQPPLQTGGNSQALSGLMAPDQRERPTMVVGSKKPHPPPALPEPPVQSVVASEMTLRRGTWVEEGGDPEGVLHPVLIIGLGYQGLSVLQALRAGIWERFGDVDALPNTRLLYIDTDQECAHLAASRQSGTGLTAAEILVAKLARPSHYLRSQEGRSSVDGWINPRMIYRIPRNLVTGGIRALGRLAFIDNHRAITRRLAAELDECRSKEKLQTAAERTQLGIRSTLPRIYLVSSLAGGTGSGMLVDIAYLIRKLLRERGCKGAEIVGVLHAPRVHSDQQNPLAITNTFAALVELNYFSNRDRTFTARYGEKGRPVQDKSAPLHRLMLWPKSDSAGDDGAPRAAQLVADLVLREVASPLGRRLEQCRERNTNASESQGPTCQSFGLYRAIWPRRALVRETARRVCAMLIQHWVSKEASNLRDFVQAGVVDFLTQQQICGERLLTLLPDMMAPSLGAHPETLLNTALAGVDVLPERDPETCVHGCRQILSQLDNVLGRPDMTEAGKQPLLYEPLALATRNASLDWGGRLTEFVLQFVEQPQLRLAAAEEAARTLNSTFEESLKRYETLGHDLGTKASEAHERIESILQSLSVPNKGAKKQVNALAALAELIRVYSKWRFQSLLLQRVTGVCVSLRGKLSDQLRELNFCRDRLADLLQAFSQGCQEVATTDTPVHGCFIFPSGCGTFRDAVQRMLDGLNPQEIYGLDGAMQTLIEQDFRSLAYVCLSSTNLIGNLEAGMTGIAEAFVRRQLREEHAAEMYLSRHPDLEAAREELAKAYARIRPTGTKTLSSPDEEISVVGFPDGTASNQIQGMLEAALPGVSFNTTITRDELILYREVPRVPLSELPQMGSTAYDAYAKMCAMENFTPHSRCDITDWDIPASVDAEAVL